MGSLTLLLVPLVLPSILVARTSTGLPRLSGWLCVPWLLSLCRCTGCTLRGCSLHSAVVSLVFFFCCCCCWTASPHFLVLESQLLCCWFYHVLLEHCWVVLEFLLLVSVVLVSVLVISVSLFVSVFISVFVFVLVSVLVSV